VIREGHTHTRALAHFSILIFFGLNPALLDDDFMRLQLPSSDQDQPHTMLDQASHQRTCPRTHAFHSASTATPASHERSNPCDEAGCLVSVRAHLISPLRLHSPALCAPLPRQKPARVMSPAGGETSSPPTDTTTNGTSSDNNDTVLDDVAGWSAFAAQRHTAVGFATPVDANTTISSVASGDRLMATTTRSGGGGDDNSSSRSGGDATRLNDVAGWNSFVAPRRVVSIKAGA
jgi:hypothetical protein